MDTHLKKIARFFSWTSKERWLCLQAFYWLWWSSMALSIMPFKKLTSRFGNKQMETSLEQQINNVELIQDIAKAIDRARGFAFWRPNCYPQAIAAKIMLKKRHIPSTLYVGVTKKDDVLKAHAWTRAQDIILTGGKVAPEYSVLATFS